MEIVAEGDDRENQISILLGEFHKIFSFIYSEYSIYKQFNNFIWTVVILQFIFVSSNQSIETSNLNRLIDLVLGDSSYEELPLYIKCFDVLSNLHEKSFNQSESEKSIQTTQVSMNEQLDCNEKDFSTGIKQCNERIPHCLILSDNDILKNSLIMHSQAFVEIEMTLDYPVLIDQLCTINSFSKKICRLWTWKREKKSKRSLGLTRSKLVKKSLKRQLILLKLKDHQKNISNCSVDNIANCRKRRKISKGRSNKKLKILGN